MSKGNTASDVNKRLVLSWYVQWYSVRVYIHGRLMRQSLVQTCGAAVCHNFSHVSIRDLIQYWNRASEEGVFINVDPRFASPAL